MSTLPANMLPSSLNKPGARRLCQVKSRLPTNMKMKNSKWYQRSDKYFKAEFDVQVLIGAADLRFQTLDKDGLLSQDHNAIDVDWYGSTTAAHERGFSMMELSTEGASPVMHVSPTSGSWTGSAASPR